MYIKVMEKEKLNEKDELENYFYLNLTKSSKKKKLKTHIFNIN
jgi:hypothetical protein